MITLRGTVEGIIYRNDDNGYTVFVLSMEDTYETVTGTFPLLREGDFISVYGLYVENKTYGTQFKADSYEMLTPETASEVELYLSSGLIKGIGQKTARDIVDYFGDKALDIIENEPEKLLLVSGIGQVKAKTIHTSYMDIIGAKKTVVFLQKHHISPKTALKIYSYYGENTITLLKENPYRLISDIEGIGFISADSIASNMGLDKNSDFRISAGIKYVLQEAMNEGHTYLPKNLLIERASTLLGVDSYSVEYNIRDLGLSHALRGLKGENGESDSIYLTPCYDAEEVIALTLLYIQEKFRSQEDKHLEKEIEAYEKHKNITLAENQRLAVKTALNSGVSVITGGPGTGKTTILDCALHLLRKRGINTMLCAPTGRAAKRMSEATGEDAKTIHRLLEYGKNDDGNFFFKRNAENPLPEGVVIIDETSMLDIFLLKMLLNALNTNSKIIFVGDADQLPSVGAGNVLKDIIASNCFPCIKLTEIFRQDKESTIILNAHRINNSEMPLVNAKGGDFFLDRKFSEQDITSTVIDLVKRRLPSAYKYSPFTDIQVLTPIKKGTVGVFNLNKLLQESLNPPRKNKKEHISGENIFREGDKIMQIRNNYDRQWYTFDKYNNMLEGTGVFNGDVGIITEIDVSELKVKFDDNKYSVYSFQDLEELTLAYAISVHKSQGCEFPCVVMPLPLLNIRIMTKNLLYTAVTRATKMVVLCGADNSIQSTVNNLDTQKRFSGLKRRLIYHKNL